MAKDCCCEKSAAKALSGERSCRRRTETGNMEYQKKTGEPAAQMDFYIEGLRMSDVMK